MATTATTTHTATTATTQLDRILTGKVTVHHRPTGTAVDACTWCDLTDPAPAVVSFSRTLVPDACLDCAPDAARTAYAEADTDHDADRIGADIGHITNPTVLSEDTDPEPGAATITDADGRELRAHAIGVELILNDTGHRRPVARFDATTQQGRDALTTLRDAINDTLRVAS